MKIDDLRMAAAQRGHVTFDAGVACAQCNSTIRYVSANQCAPCARSRAAERNHKIRSALKKARAKAAP